MSDTGFAGVEPSYSLRFHTAVEKELAGVSGDGLLTKIAVAIIQLKYAPRPVDSIKLKNTKQAMYRFGVGSWRVIYAIDYTNKIVKVYRVGDRKEVYNKIRDGGVKLIQYQGVIYRAVTALPEPTDEMIEHFETRTQEHIDRVKKFLLLLDGAGDFTPEELTQRGEAHDADKFSDEKFIPYVWVTEYYRIKNSGQEVPADVKQAYDATREALGDHVTINRHHPESHEDLNDMTDLDVAEMVSDWSAMAEELGEGSALGWADKHVGKKWKFDEEHVELIYEMVDRLEAEGEKDE